MGFKTPSRIMAGTITLLLLVFFGFVLILPVFQPDAKLDPALTQTLLTLVVVAVSYYIGTSNSSANKDETIATQAASQSGLDRAPRNGPLDVSVINKPGNPVPVVEKEKHEAEKLNVRNIS